MGRHNFDSAHESSARRSLLEETIKQYQKRNRSLLEETVKQYQKRNCFFYFKKALQKMRLLNK